MDFANTTFKVVPLGDIGMATLPDGKPMPVLRGVGEMPAGGGAFHMSVAVDVTPENRPVFNCLIEFPDLEPICFQIPPEAAGWVKAVGEVKAFGLVNGDESGIAVLPVADAWAERAMMYEMAANAAARGVSVQMRDPE